MYCLSSKEIYIYDMVGTLLHSYKRSNMLARGIILCDVDMHGVGLGVRADHVMLDVAGHADQEVVLSLSHAIYRPNYVVVDTH